MPKTEVRFSELVKTSGKPAIFSLWIEPEKDRGFKRAIKENRVLTLIQEPGAKKRDWGRIGFHPEPHASYLIFPEPLPEGQPGRVVGIKYELTAAAEVKDPLKIERPQADRNGSNAAENSAKRSALRADPEPKPQPVAPKAEAVQKDFEVIVRRLGIIETSIKVKARTKREARTKALEMAKHEPFDVSKAVFKEEVRSVQ